jgi:hypothetical protein
VQIVEGDDVLVNLDVGLAASKAAMTLSKLPGSCALTNVRTVMVARTSTPRRRGRLTLCSDMPISSASYMA